MKVALAVQKIKRSDRCRAGGDALVKEVGGVVTIIDELHAGRPPAPEHVNRYSEFYKTVLARAASCFWLDILSVIDGTAAVQKSATGQLAKSKRIFGTEALQHQF